MSWEASLMSGLSFLPGLYLSLAKPPKIPVRQSRYAIHGTSWVENSQDNLKLYGLVCIQGKLDQAEPVTRSIKRTGPAHVACFSCCAWANVEGRLKCRTEMLNSILDTRCLQHQICNLLTLYTRSRRNAYSHASNQKGPSNFIMRCAAFLLPLGMRNSSGFWLNFVRLLVREIDRGFGLYLQK